MSHHVTVIGPDVQKESIVAAILLPPCVRDILGLGSCKAGGAMRKSRFTEELIGRIVNECDVSAT